MSTTDETLARMIGRLRNYRRGGRYKWDPALRYYRTMEGGRIWTDEQIRETLGLNQGRFNDLLEIHQNTPPRYFSDQEWKKRYFKFWDKNKRWHTRKDMKNWRETGLPSRDHWQVHDWIQHYCSLREGRLRKYPELVLSIPNLTTRRNVITQLGGADALVQRLVERGQAKQLQQDDFGILWRLDFPDGQDSHMRYVEVVNTTPNEKGVHDHYFLRVPPTTVTARGGVAWTFEKSSVGFKFAAQS